MSDKRDIDLQSTKRQIRILPADSFGDWKWREGLAELMVPIIGNLYRDGINVLIYGKSLVNESPVGIMRAHRFARQVDENELSEQETFPILQYISTLNLADCEIDIGELAVNYPQFEKLKDDSSGISSYIDKELEMNERIEQERFSTVASLVSRPDVITIGTVSVIYGLNAPEVFEQNHLRFHVNQEIDPQDAIKELVGLQLSLIHI